MATTSKSPAPAKTAAVRPPATPAKAEKPTSEAAAVPVVSPQPYSPRPVNVYAAISLTAGIASLMGLIVPAAPIAIILGHTALAGITRNGERGRGSAIFGLIAGYLSLVVWFIIFIVAAAAIIATVQNFPQMVNDATTGVIQDSLG